MLIRIAKESITIEMPQWENVAGILLAFKLEQQVTKFFSEHQMASGFYSKIKYLTEEGLYFKGMLESYSRAELEEAESFIDNTRTLLFSFSGLDLLKKRYLIRDRQGENILETPQEMFLGIALHIAIQEKNDRMHWVKTYYDMLSKLQVTMATPTMLNARKPFHQLSSCFIDVVGDSLDSIFKSVDNFAQVSKYGGGMGLYFGKIRPQGSEIRGMKGASGNLIKWIKIINDTAVAVDQLGARQGAVAVYLDVWHPDILDFIQMRTNNGDDRQKAHDVFPVVCYPDLFWKKVKEDINQPWHLMSPYEIRKVKGYNLEDFWGEEWEKRYEDCLRDDRINKKEVALKDLVRLILKSQVETGTPFTFNRDIVNKYNPNPHKGIIYSSNLCTEIAQNMSQIEKLSQEIMIIDGEEIVVTRHAPGEFVVCNLASLVLGRLPMDDDDALEKIVYGAVRALDSVIDVNMYPLPYAQITNNHYRAIGLGVSGYHHLLAKKNINWESEKHLEFSDNIFEKINMLAVKASALLGEEKGSYKFFEGSDWQTGKYFEKRKYESQEWENVRALTAKSMRNGYVMAIAPTSSTSIIAGTTPGIDPVMKKFYLEEKKGAVMPRVAPELNNETFWYYKGAYEMDQTWSIKAAGRRGRHLDQAQSLNIYITNQYSFRQILDLFILAWEEELKTIYYVKNKSLEVDEQAPCEYCSG